MKHNQYIIIPLLFAVLITSCKKSYFPKEIEMIDITINRFDLALLSFDTTDAAGSVRKLYNDFPEFMKTFSEDILGIDYSDSSFLSTALPSFLNDTIYGFKETNARAKEQFSNIDDIQKPLNLAFSRWKYIEPELALPNICFFLSN